MARKNPHAVALGRRGGKVVTPKKIAALRKNARLGGRKPKFQAGDRVRANDHAPGDYKERVGTVRAIGPGRAEYEVTFEPEGDKPTSGHLMSWWLDREKAVKA